jgi:hypothetical protein
VEVNAKTGQRTSPDDPNAIFEAFLKEDEPEDGISVENGADPTDTQEWPAEQSPEPVDEETPQTETAPAPTLGGGTGGIY